MKILVACEKSGIVREAFIRKGHDAISCDILPSDIPGPHLQNPVEDIIGGGWDMIIAFPPCTYLASSGLHWNKRVPGRKEKTEQALHFVAMILNQECKKIVVENPIGCISTRIKKVNGLYIVQDDSKPGRFRASQIIQPYEFGHDASKATCLWIKGLPNLIPSKYIEPRIVNGKKRWDNQTDGGQNKLPPSEERASLRGITYQGIANAMAEQWSTYRGLPGFNVE